MEAEPQPPARQLRCSESGEEKMKRKAALNWKGSLASWGEGLSYRLGTGFELTGLSVLLLTFIFIKWHKSFDFFIDSW